MSTTGSKKLSTTRSFPRLEPTHAHPPPISRSRSSTLSEAHLPVQTISEDPLSDQTEPEKSSLFENKPASEDVSTQASTTLTHSPHPEFDSLPEGFDDLPIELKSLADRFIASLTTARIYPTPPSAEKLSDLFQDFYVQAESHISTHIQILSSRQYRDTSPARSVSSRSSKLNSKSSHNSLKRIDSTDGGQKMLTPEEIAERKKARRLLDHKRIALEEAIERRVCEGIYDKIWRHKSTLDDEKDEKLRSKAAALAVVGIGLKDLGIELSAVDSDGARQEQQTLLEKSIAKAREGLFAMNQSHNPLGKLQGLAATHQTIVELLTQIHQGSSSADEILPTLIYTLIQSPAEEVNAISNLNFIQRFRCSAKINGEAAYCLTNLEAAITFLETVDLGSLRAEEAIANSKPTTPSSADKPSFPASGSEFATSTSSAGKASPVTTPVTARPAVMSPTTPRAAVSDLKNARQTSPASPSHQRRLSSLLQPTVALGAASDVVMSTADEGFRNIKSTLDGSFNLLFGRLKEQSTKAGTGAKPTPILVPKTLDEARKMISPRAMIDEDGTVSETSSIAEAEDSVTAQKEDRLLGMIAGSRQPRERSTDSAGSGNRRVTFTSDSRSPGGIGVSPPVSAAAAVESMRNLGNTLNPLNRFSAGMNMVRGFGRATGGTPPVVSPAIPTEIGKVSPGVGTVTQGIEELEIGPPVARFLGLKDARDLKIGEVDELLKDYQRLAQILKLKGMA